MLPLVYQPVVEHRLLVLQTGYRCSYRHQCPVLITVAPYTHIPISDKVSVYTRNKVYIPIMKLTVLSSAAPVKSSC